MHLGERNIAVIGATGAVGREMLNVLAQRSVSASRIRAFASPASAGKSVPYLDGAISLSALSPQSIDGIGSGGGGGVALMSAGSGVSREWAPRLVERGYLVVDNSSAFRMNRDVPLVIPEINPQALGRIGRDGWAGIVAVPNCSAIIMLMAVNPLREAFGIERIVVSTYQAASGAGAKGIAELERQVRDVVRDAPDLSGGDPGPIPAGPAFHEPYAFNLFSHNTAVDPHTGLNVEEQKMIDETRKIWSDAAVQVCPTCIRVPVLRAHSESICVTLRTPATLAQVRAAIEAAPGVRLADDRAANAFPTPLKASGGDDVLVGRIRPDPGADPEHATRIFHLFVCGDQLRKGAALNAVQIAEFACSRS